MGRREGARAPASLAGLGRDCYVVGMQPEPSQTVARRFSASCAARGLDICHPFAADSVNQRLAAAASAAPSFALPTFGRSAQAFLIGNTRALWPLIRDVISAARQPHPLNNYVEVTLTALATELGFPFWLGWSHRPSPQVLPMQRIALAAGFADLAPSYLSVHPQWGPWFGLRAVVVLDLDAAPTPQTPPALCAPCSKPCVAAFENARAGQTATAEAVRANAARWIAVRDACPFGREFRYDEEQLAYHYVGTIPKRTP